MHNPGKKEKLRGMDENSKERNLKTKTLVTMNTTIPTQSKNNNNNHHHKYFINISKSFLRPCNTCQEYLHR